MDVSLTPDGSLLPLARVALTSPAEPKGRIAALVDLTHHWMNNGDRSAADLALTEAVATLNSNQPTSGEGFDLAAEAWELGHSAMRLQRYAIAAEAFEAGLTAVEDDPKNPLRGMLWQAVGACRSRLGDNRKALSCLREAADAKREANDARSRLITLKNLIEAEAQLGKSELCDLAVAESISVLEAAVGGPRESEGDLADLAHQAGRATEAALRPALARRVYELALTLKEEGRSMPSAGVILHDIGDTWVSQGDGSRALAAYRAANDRKRDDRDGVTRLVTLNALAAGEARWGERDRCELAIAEAAEVAGSFNGSPVDPALAEIGRRLRQLALQMRRIDLAASFYSLAPPEQE